MFGWFKGKAKRPASDQEAKRIMDGAIDIVVRYGEIWRGVGTAIVDTSRLPVTKTEMKTALKLAWRFAEGDQRTQNWVEGGYVLLAHFQNGIGAEPIDCKLSSSFEISAGLFVEIVSRSSCLSSRNPAWR